MLCKVPVHISVTIIITETTTHSNFKPYGPSEFPEFSSFHHQLVITLVSDPIIDPPGLLN